MIIMCKKSEKEKHALKIKEYIDEDIFTQTLTDVLFFVSTDLLVLN